MSDLPQVLLAVLAAGLLLYLLAAALVAERFTSPLRERLDMAPPADLRPATVRFPSRGDGLALAGWHLRAADARGAVILVHGRGCSKATALQHDAVLLVRTLLDQGLSVLMIDLRGHGDSAPSRMTYGSNERRDVQGALDWLLGQGYAPGTIGVLGVSMGACAAIAAAAEEPGLHAVVSDSAFADFHAVLRHNFPRVMRTRLALALLPGALWFVQRRTGVALHRFRPAQIAGGLRGRPLLVIHSEHDRFVLAEHAHALGTASGTQPWISPTRGHVGTYATDPHTYARRVAGFFARHLPARGALRQRATMIAAQGGGHEHSPRVSMGLAPLRRRRARPGQRLAGGSGCGAVQ